MKTLLKTGLSVTLLLAGLSVADVASADVVTCQSRGGEQHFCRADTSGGVTLVKQLSRAGCWKHDTWGFNRSGIWVANGCRAEFRTGWSGSERRGSYYHNDDRWEDRDSHDADDDAKKALGAALAIGLVAAAAKSAADHDRHDDDNYDNYSNSYYDRRSVVKCESDSARHHYCHVRNRTLHHAELKRQLSKSSCRYNRTWGYDRSGIWVSEGCRAEFWVE